MSIIKYNVNLNLPLNNTSLMNSTIPNYVLEEQAIANGLGGGYYDNQLHEVIPKIPSLINRIFECTKTYISNKIGSIYSGNQLGLNTATNLTNLRDDAQAAATKFIKIINKVSEVTGGEANFGPGDMFAIKSENSLIKKIANDARLEQISTEQATKKIGDALRGMIIVDSEDMIQSIVKKTNEFVEQEGGEVIWKNIFQENRDDGYIGIHGKILLPFTDQNGENRQIRSELQLHFRSVADGSLDSPKERMHLLYKDFNEILSQKSVSISKAISKLSFLSGLASIGNICRNPKYLLNRCLQNPTSSKNLCKDPTFNFLCKGNLGIPRYQMPQLSGSIKTDFLQEKENQGIKIERCSKPANQLIPVQSELSKEKIEELVRSFYQGSYNPCKSAILISSRNENDKLYVIDGHHRYAACRLIGGNQEMIAIDDNVNHLLFELAIFPGVRWSGIENATVRH